MSQPSLLRRTALVVVLLACLLAPGAALGGPPDLIIAPANPSAGDPLTAVGDARESDPVPAGEIREVSLATLDQLQAGGALLADAAEVGKANGSLPQGRSEVAGAPEAAGAWTTLMTEGFEGAFPAAGWTVSDNNGVGDGNPNSTWDDDDCRAYTGSWSA